METELSKARAELDNTLMEHTKLKTSTAAREKSLNVKVSKQEEELSTLRLEQDRLKNKVSQNIDVKVQVHVLPEL